MVGFSTDQIETLKEFAAQFRITCDPTGIGSRAVHCDGVPGERAVAPRHARGPRPARSSTTGAVIMECPRP
jgi:hypothetical protein